MNEKIVKFHPAQFIRRKSECTKFFVEGEIVVNAHDHLVVYAHVNYEAKWFGDVSFRDYSTGHTDHLVEFGDSMKYPEWSIEKFLKFLALKWNNTKGAKLGIKISFYEKKGRK